MRVSKMTVYRLVHNGELPAVRVGRSFRVHAKAVHDMLETSYFDAGCARRRRGGTGPARARSPDSGLVFDASGRVKCPGPIFEAGHGQIAELWVQ